MMAINDRFVLTVAIGVLAMQMTLAQRPPFAGSRPPNGLNQKDKYNTNSISSTPEVSNRFGDSAEPISNIIPYGQPQRPPVGHVVTPITPYIPLPSPANVPSSVPNTNASGVNFADRFGDAGSNAVISPGASTTTSRPVRPLDAHGDLALIDKLSKLPPDQQPFWFVNYQAIEAQRNGTAANVAGSISARGSFFG
ncbi:uncharacterized protein LOC133326105 [Musca vetustissima]|uniref:uncharacterized protein LOC133326105 n=1 Tax=Musca vetustissima TaxID=27455 RepID=UPI002AB615F4|nr:uncharacterized protein LOC133326105 [Musca vetustissima]